MACSQRDWPSTATEFSMGRSFVEAKFHATSAPSGVALFSVCLFPEGRLTLVESAPDAWSLPRSATRVGTADISGQGLETLATLESSIASAVLKMGYDGDYEHGHDGRYDKNG